MFISECRNHLLKNSILDLKIGKSFDLEILFSYKNIEKINSNDKNKA
jgi:hypothetical protein